MTAEALATRLDAKRNGKSWKARCPVHDDEHPSLSITDGADGRVLLKCHAQQCEAAAILSTVGLELKDIMGDAAHRRVPTGRRTIIATYDYDDEHDNLLYQAVRYEPKDFRQRRPDGKGGWIWNMKDVRRVLYRLPEVRRRIADSNFRRQQGFPDDVFIVEGEKDADHLMMRGLIATTNVGGAGKWCDDYSRQLVEVGAPSVVVIADNDDAGRKHAQDVARSCHAAGLA